MFGQLGPEVEEEDLFAAALVLPTAERERYLQRACAGNASLLARLKALLDAFGDAASFIEHGLDEANLTCQIGAYRIVRELGEGGCGVAYLAEQLTPVRREVALKLIKPGMDTNAVIERFEAERQVLALLDHPNIAKVFDAGATSQGRPYLVMELIRGIRITEYCVQSRMTISQRLSLFIQVCQAIQHAHQNGIIHRDIKPSNVLVTVHDGSPLAKVIDFGIAKATQGKLIDQTLHTEIDQIMGTPAYISPEQTQALPTSIDTRSDIYSLGVLLYELLTSHTPFDAHELAEVGIDELRKRIRTEEPIPPSRRLASFDDALLTRIAIGSGTMAATLVRQVRDDLDWIVMQCLEKEPSRRYQTVNELIADLNRHLRHEMVLARPPSLFYTVRKFAHRNRIAFASALTALAFVVFIVAFSIMMTIQAQRIAVERDRAEAQRQQAEKVLNVILNVVAVADPFQSLDSNLNGSALLDQAARSIERELQDQPVVRARMRQAIGRAYTRRGEFKSSVQHLRDAVEVLSRSAGGEAETLTALIDLSYALRNRGDLKGAHEQLTKGDDLAARNGLTRSATYARLLMNRGRVQMIEGRVPEAQASFQRSLELYRRVVGAHSPEVAEVLGDLSEAYLWVDDTAAAERAARQAITIFESTVPAIHPDRVRTESVLAEALYLLNRQDEAATILLDALRKNTQLFGPTSGQVADILDRLSVVRYSQGRLAESESLAREALSTARIAYGSQHVLTSSIATTLGRTLVRLHKYAEAETTLREALDTFAIAIPDDHQYTASTEYFLGETLIATNRFTEAEEVLADSMSRWNRAGAPPWRAARSASALGEAVFRQGRTQEATRYLIEGLRDLSSDPNSDVEARKTAEARVARFVTKASATRSPSARKSVAAQ